MAVMVSGLYDAPRTVGGGDEAARKAAKEVADHQKQPSEIRTDLAVVKAMLGVLIAGVAALVLETFFG